MCGIAGILNTAPSGDISSPLGRMQEALGHRGPDDAGVWRQRDGIACFAHTRLSILDLTSAGHQPMSTPDGRLSITFNGEIYNFAELRTALEREGDIFHTRTDTEVILRLFERHGMEALKLLRGMFAFAIWDESNHSCLLARDGFGIKPLYYAQDEERLIFASELRALLASGLVGRRTHPHALERYFETGSVPEPLAMAHGVHMLEAGSLLQWHKGKAQIRRWWNIAFPSSQSIMTASQAAEQTRAALLDSVEHHFVSDVPVGIFLSGGIDSTALLALAHATGRRNIRTFSIGIDDASRDESELASRTAEHFGTQHAELRLTADLARDRFTKFLEVVDQPTIDGFNTFCVSALAREHGMKVVLSGLGGDEIFGGYPSFTQLPRLAKLSRALGAMRAAAGAILEKLNFKPQLIRLGSALRDGGSLEQLYDAFRGVFSGADARRLTKWLTGTKQDADHSKPRAPEPKEPSAHLQDQISELELRRYMLNQLLRDSDVMSMAHGLELRVPLVDSTLFDVVSQIPAELRLRPGKQLLLDAVPEIPEWIRDRPKSGFLLPYEQWLATSEWQAMFADALRDVPVPITSWYQRWSVFMVHQWCVKHGMLPLKASA